MQFDRGYASAYMVTDTDKMEAVLDNPLHPHHRQEDLQHSGDPAAARAGRAGRASKLLIIAEDIEGEALATLVVNKLRGTFTCVAVKAPGFGDRRKAMLQDIAILTGGQVISEELGYELKERDRRYARLARVRSRLTRTTPPSSRARATRRISRRASPRSAPRSSETTSDYDREKLQERLAKLAGGVAVIQVGAATEIEMKERKMRIEDALSATRAAVEEGIVPGGGTALLSVLPAGSGAAAEVQRRREDRRADRPARAGRAGSPDRGQRGRGRLRHRREDQAHQASRATAMTR